MRALLSTIARIPFVGRTLLGAYRAWLGFRHVGPSLWQIVRWLVVSREITNFTYDLTPANLKYLAVFVSEVTGATVEMIDSYLQEPAADTQLQEHLRDRLLDREFRAVADRQIRFGRRLGWYAIARVMKPRVIIETGVDKGLGSCLLAAALKRNASEGFPGRYFGTDINPRAGFLLSGPYADWGSIIYGDSLASLTGFDQQIDLFINDSDHSLDYEAKEYLAVAPKLSDGAVILGDNSHWSDRLLEYSRRADKSFLLFLEQPTGHWYSGAGIGASFRRQLPNGHRDPKVHTDHYGEDHRRGEHVQDA